MDSFKKSYRSLDLLLIDDIQKHLVKKYLLKENSLTLLMPLHGK